MEEEIIVRKTKYLALKIISDIIFYLVYLVYLLF